MAMLQLRQHDHDQIYEPGNDLLTGSDCHLEAQAWAKNIEYYDDIAVVRCNVRDLPGDVKERIHQIAGEDRGDYGVAIIGFRQLVNGCSIVSAVLFREKDIAPDEIEELIEVHMEDRASRDIKTQLTLLARCLEQYLNNDIVYPKLLRFDVPMPVFEVLQKAGAYLNDINMVAGRASFSILVNEALREIYIKIKKISESGRVATAIRHLDKQTRRRKGSGKHDHTDQLTDAQRQFGDRYGKTYGALEEIQAYRQMQAWIAGEVMADDFAGTVIDFGCGRAFLGEVLYRQQWEGSYVGCDNQMAMTEPARRRMSGFSASSTLIHEASMDDLLEVLPNASQERLVAAMSVYTIGDWDRQSIIISQMIDKLKDGGRLVITFPVPSPDITRILAAHQESIRQGMRADDIGRTEGFWLKTKTVLMAPVIMGQNRRLIRSAEKGEIHFPSVDEVEQLVVSLGCSVVEKEVLYSGQANCFVIEK